VAYLTSNLLMRFGQKLLRCGYTLLLRT